MASKTHGATRSSSKARSQKAKRGRDGVKPTSSFGKFANEAARIAGRPVSFCLAVLVLVAWAVSGPMFGFSDTWQLVINTVTTLVTFLMVFLIQSSQNRDSEAIQIKLDELVRAMDGAHLALLDLEELDESDLDRIRADYRALADQARRDLRAGRSDTSTPEATGAAPRDSGARTRKPRRRRSPATRA
jgi:low affinity Fe/Cu permease